MATIYNASDIDYDIMCRLSGYNVEITLLNGDIFTASVGKFYDDIIFNGEFLRKLKLDYTDYSRQIKAFKSVKVIELRQG